MSKEIFVIIEHRRGTIRDVSYELLTKANDFANNIGGSTAAVILGNELDEMVQHLKSSAHKIIALKNEKLGDFHSEYYQEALKSIIEERSPLLVMLGHTSASYDLAPALAVAMGLPLISGCSDLRLEGNKVITLNQVYGGKINAEYSFETEKGGIITLLPGSVPAKPGGLSAEVEEVNVSFEREFEDKVFIQFVESAAGEIDITQAEKIIAIGRGIKEEDNIAMIEEFAQSIGAVVACSRPIVDAGWLPKDRQVGSSGKTVKPKVYIALGISGDFQHLMGMRNADTIIAVNKDPNAPIFGAADYGIVDDLFKVVPAIKDKLAQL
ncbi:electron transfer flavoprotein subunit alpha/FixB family protein [bacterium]|nr:electron transfer flavoprotein subunit alpha/FixB family protein [bacterium]